MKLIVAIIRPERLNEVLEALYRAEKARRAHAPDDAVMIEAKRLRDEAIAETGKKRAGMRSAVVPPSQRRGATAAEPAGEG